MWLTLDAQREIPAAAIRWIYSDLRFDYQEENSPALRLLRRISQPIIRTYVNIGPRECQLGVGLNISNIGSKITFSGQEYGEFLPTNLRSGRLTDDPIETRVQPLYHRRRCQQVSRADGPAQKEGEDNSGMKTVCIANTTIFRASAASSGASAMLQADSRKSWRKSTMRRCRVRI